MRGITGTVAGALALWFAAGAGGAAAQEQRFGEGLWAGTTRVDVTTRFSSRGGRPHGEVEVSAGGASRRVHDGAPAHAWSAASERGVLLALVGASASVDVVWVPLEQGRPGAPRRTRIQRLAGADRAPVGAAVAARPDGFAVVWQEASTSNPTALYETFIARFDADGGAVGPSRPVAAPWPLADVAWLPGSRQYYFLLYYGGLDPRGTRLCGVHVIEPGLHNAEHPWWASPPGAIDEARLVVRDGDAVTAVYRADGQLYDIDVTTGTWGRDPSAAARREHGAIAPEQVFSARAVGAGVQVELH